MGLTGALELGKSALLSYQSALQVVGNNIANSGTDGYTRQTPEMSSLQGVPLPEGISSGGGVALTALQRNLDEAIEARLRSALSDEQNKTSQQQSLSDIESMYNELTDNDLSSSLSAFFNSFSAVQNQPNDMTLRSNAITTGTTLATKIQQMRSDLLKMHDQLDSQVVDAVGQANDLSKQVADLNLEIVHAESSGTGKASSLRDQRDNVLKQLSNLVDVQTYETPQGAVSVYVGSEPLVQDAQSRGLETVTDSTGDGSAVNVRFADGNGSVQISSGKIAGLITSRDNYVYGQVKQLDGLASNLIQQVNRIHSQGQGLTGFSSVTGQYGVEDADAALNSGAAGLAYPPVSGSFKMTVTTVTNATSTPPQTQSKEYDIPVSLPGTGGGTTLNDLANYINGNVAGAAATVTATKGLQITASGDNTITFGKDTSGVLSSLGINSFFTGTSAQDIGVQTDLPNHPEWLAGSSNGQPGDGSNAGTIAALADDQKAAPGTNILAQWRSVVSSLATVSSTASNASEAAHNVSQSLQSQREAVSGVNTDEEAVNLMTYQRSFQAAARYITIVDQLVDEMLSMVK